MKLGIVVLDTLRYDIAKDEMETLWNAADHLFEQMYAPSRWTVASHGSLFTGLYPTESGTHNNYRHLTSEKSTLAERLYEAEYDTFLYSNNPYIDSFYQFDRGFATHTRGPACRGRPGTKSTSVDWDSIFDQIDDGPIRYVQAVKKLIQSDASTPAALKEGIQMLRRPSMEEATFETNCINWFFDAVDSHDIETADQLFLYANLMPAHYPYDPPAEYRSLEPYNDIDPQKLAVSELHEDKHKRQLECYRGTARYLDDQIQEILDLCDWDALFIISDHGELFGEHELRLHNYGLYEELVHVPAVAYGSLIPNGTTSQLTSLLDLHHTILDLAEIPHRSDDRGLNLFDDTDRKYVYSESTGCENEYTPESWDREYYAIRTQDGSLISDKDGTRCTTAKGSNAPTELKNELQELAEEVRSNRILSESESVKEETVPDDIGDRLEALGYR